MNRKKIIIVGVIIALLAVTLLTVIFAIPHFYREKDKTGADSKSGNTLYREALSAIEQGDSARARDLFTQAKEYFVDDESYEANEKTLDINSQLRALDDQEEVRKLEEENAKNIPLAESGG